MVIVLCFPLVNTLFRVRAAKSRYGVAVHPPVFCQHSHLLQRVEDVTVEELIVYLAVEVVTVAVLLRTARFDVHRL